MPGEREPIGTTPFEYTLLEGVGSATLRVQSEGYRAQDIEIVAGRTEPFAVKLQREEPERKPRPKSQPKPPPKAPPKSNPLDRM